MPSSVNLDDVRIITSYELELSIDTDGTVWITAESLFENMEILARAIAQNKDYVKEVVEDGAMVKPALMGMTLFYTTLRMGIRECMHTASQEVKRGKPN